MSNWWQTLASIFMAFQSRRRVCLKLGNVKSVGKGRKVCGWRKLLLWRKGSLGKLVSPPKFASRESWMGLQMAWVKKPSHSLLFALIWRLALCLHMRLKQALHWPLGSNSTWFFCTCCATSGGKGAKCGTRRDPTLPVGGTVSHTLQPFLEK